MLDVVFSRFSGFSFTIPRGGSPKKFRTGSDALSLPGKSTLPALNCFGLLSQGYCERKPLNFEKTTSIICVFFLSKNIYDLPT